MSLVVALAKSKEAVIGGDRRSITFLGSCPELEQDLYSGLIKDDEALLARAKEAGATLQVADGRDKVWRRGDILVGEVTEITPQLDRRRRIYVTPGAHLQVEISGNEVRVKDRGVAGCIIYGNRFTQQIAVSIVVQASGRVDEALVREIFQKAGEKAFRSPEGFGGGPGRGLPGERLEAMRSAVILAGGRSQRLGREKALLQFDNRPLISWTAEILLSAADELVVVARDRGHAGSLEEIVSDKADAIFLS